MMNRYSPAAATWEVSATMALDDKGSWIHIAEYEKLQAEIKQLRLRLKPSIDYTDGIPIGYGEDEIDRQQAEIERLRKKANIDDNLLYAETEKVYLAEKEIEQLRSGARCPHCDELRLELGEARSEIKQLHAEAKQKQADLVSLARDLGKNERFRQAIWIVNEQLEAEIKQLRELLRELFRHWMADSDPDELQDLVKRVNEALGHE